jgi:uncharacterized protein (TIGR00255 family)
MVCKMPYVLNQFETDFIKIIKSKLYRGQVYLTIHSTEQNIFKPSIEPSIDLISEYLKALEKIKKEFKLSGNIAINDILRIPDIFVAEEKGVDENFKEILFDAISELLDELVQERKKEGFALEKDFEKRSSFMQQSIEQIERTSEKEIAELKEKVSQKIQEINLNTGDNLAESQRQSLYLTLDKIDIHEEIVRFKSHLKNIATLFQSPAEEKGKQLDFTLQDLSREINTLTAKTQNSKIIELAIAIKVEVEKMREQAQNIV